MIEIKTDQYEYPGIEEKLAETLKAEIGLFQHAYCSFHLASLEKIALLEPEIQLDLLMSTSDKKDPTSSRNPLYRRSTSKKYLVVRTSRPSS